MLGRGGWGRWVWLCGITERGEGRGREEEGGKRVLCAFRFLLSGI